jgi:hypothetical protein
MLHGKVIPQADHEKFVCHTIQVGLYGLSTRSITLFT